jgi:hypothetical protein
VYVGVPPDAVTLAVVVPPLQEIFPCDVVALTAVGDVIVNVCAETQPLLSVTVHVYVPAPRPVALAPVPPLGAHE